MINVGGVNERQVSKICKNKISALIGRQNDVSLCICNIYICHRAAFHFLQASWLTGFFVKTEENEIISPYRIVLEGIIIENYDLF